MPRRRSSPVRPIWCAAASRWKPIGRQPSRTWKRRTRSARRSPPACHQAHSRFSSACRSTARAWRCPRHATASARSATSGCVPRSTTSSAATRASCNVRAARESSTSSRQPPPPMRRHQSPKQHPPNPAADQSSETQPASREPPPTNLINDPRLYRWRCPGQPGASRLRHPHRGRRRQPDRGAARTRSALPRTTSPSTAGCWPP